MLGSAETPLSEKEQDVVKHGWSTFVASLSFFQQTPHRNDLVLKEREEEQKEEKKEENEEEKEEEEEEDEKKEKKEKEEEKEVKHEKKKVMDWQKRR